MKRKKGLYIFQLAMTLQHGVCGNNANQIDYFVYGFFYIFFAFAVEQKKEEVELAEAIHQFNRVHRIQSM